MSTVRRSIRITKADIRIQVGDDVYYDTVQYISVGSRYIHTRTWGALGSERPRRELWGSE